jgi:type IV pilus assembly protein PilF
LCSQARYKEADKEFLLAIHDYNYPKTAEIYENAGLCALKAADIVKAENYFKTAVRYDPKQVASLMELAELYFKRGDFEQARNYLTRLRAQTEPYPRMLWLAIRLARQTKDADALASNVLLLKNLFADSLEYKLYLETQEKEK